MEKWFIKMDNEFTDKEILFLVMALFEKKHLLLEELCIVHSDKEGRRNISVAYSMNNKIMKKLMATLPKLALEKINLCEEKVAKDWVKEKSCTIENFISTYIEKIDNPEKYY